MKKLLLVAFMAFISVYSFAQDVPPSTPRFAYCQIVGTNKFLSNKVTVQIDFGEEKKFFSDTRLKDPSTGKPRVFNSMIDAMNWMGKQGWEFEQAYVVTVSNQNIYHYLLKKSFTEMDEEEQKVFASETEF